MREHPTVHTSVLLQETIDGLDPHTSDTVVDATLGGGGHFRALAERLDGRGSLIGFDADASALARVEEHLAAYPIKPRVTLVASNFRHLGCELDRIGVQGIDRALFDLGISSDQLELSGRGFSLRRDEPLDMRFDVSGSETDLTAAMILNEWSEETLAEILVGFGEERRARRLAKAIVEQRVDTPFRRTCDLVTLIESVLGRGRGRIHPATKTFQALRIAVNDELGALTQGLHGAWDRLSEGGRIAVISFHSLEDRVVKRFFREQAHRRHASLLTKKPITPSEEELRQNPRSRSAKLRIAQKTTNELDTH